MCLPAPRQPRFRYPDTAGLFFDHPRPGKIQGACFRVFPLNPILRGRGTFAFRNFRFWQTSAQENSVSRWLQGVISTRLCGGESSLFLELAAENRRSRNSESLAESRYKYRRGAGLGVSAHKLTMFQGTCSTAQLLEVSRPPIPPRPRGARSPHDAAALVPRGWPWFSCAPWQMGHEAGGNPSQPRGTKTAAPCGY